MPSTSLSTSVSRYASGNIRITSSISSARSSPSVCRVRRSSGSSTCSAPGGDSPWPGCGRPRASRQTRRIAQAVKPVPGGEEHILDEIVDLGVRHAGEQQAMDDPRVAVAAGRTPGSARRPDQPGILDACRVEPGRGRTARAARDATQPPSGQEDAHRPPALTRSVPPAFAVDCRTRRRSRFPSGVLIGMLPPVARRATALQYVGYTWEFMMRQFGSRLPWCRWSCLPSPRRRPRSRP